MHDIFNNRVAAEVNATPGAGVGALESTCSAICYTATSMPYDPNRHRRRSLRLPDYDYSSPGAYFVTVCTFDRELLFGTITDGKMSSNAYTSIVRDEWLWSQEIRQEIALDTWIIMPNHLHGIVWITGQPGDSLAASSKESAHKLRARPKSLSTFITGFKSSATIRINKLRDTRGAPVWQRNYYERIVRDEYELWRIREYIVNNPANWNDDENHPSNINLSRQE